MLGAQDEKNIEKVKKKRQRRYEGRGNKDIFIREQKRLLKIFGSRQEHGERFIPKQ
jgi:hypothetical protein